MSRFNAGRTRVALKVHLLTLFLISGLLMAPLSGPPSPATAASPQSSDYVSLPVPQAPGGYVIALVQAPSDPDVLYNLIQGIDGYRLFRSLDGCLNWQERYT